MPSTLPLVFPKSLTLMKLSQALLGAILVGVTVQASSCTKNDDNKPKGKPKATIGNSNAPTPGDCCPACGRG